MKTKLALIALAALWIQAEFMSEKNRRRVNHNRDIALYFAKKLDDAGVPYEEFDKIVINNFANNKP